MISACKVSPTTNVPAGFSSEKFPVIPRVRLKSRSYGNNIRTDRSQQLAVNFQRSEYVILNPKYEILRLRSDGFEIGSDILIFIHRDIRKVVDTSSITAPVVKGIASIGVNIQCHNGTALKLAA